MPHPWVRINRRGEARHGGSWYERCLDGPRSDSSPRVLVLPAAARRHEAAAHASLLGSNGEKRQREMDGVLPAGAVAGHRGGMGGGDRGEGARGRARRVRQALQLQLRCGTNDSTKQKEIPSRDTSPAAGYCRINGVFQPGAH